MASFNRGAYHGRNRMICRKCGRDKRNQGRGLCTGCYESERTSGTLSEYSELTRTCDIEGCTEIVFAKKLCSHHYARDSHPLKPLWKNTRLRLGAGNYPASWRWFDAFLADVGERPGPKHVLRLIDPTGPWVKDNLFWLPPPEVPVKDYFTPQERADYVRNWTLKKKFGIDVTEYAALAKAQGYVCDICGNPESFINSRTKVVQELSVDHDHDTGKVRGLLCVRCNRMLGYGRDDQAILQRAIAYLAKHKL